MLNRYRLDRLSHLDRATSRAIRHYEQCAPSELVHVDTRKRGNIPDDGGHRFLGRQAGRKNRSRAGWSYLHNAVDDHSRLAYSEILVLQNWSIHHFPVELLVVCGPRESM